MAAVVVKKDLLPSSFFSDEDSIKHHLDENWCIFHQIKRFSSYSDNLREVGSAELDYIVRDVKTIIKSIKYIVEVEFEKYLASKNTDYRSGSYKLLKHKQNIIVAVLKKKHNEFGKDFEIVLVFHSSVENLNKQMKKHGPLPFTIVADPDFSYYKKYEIERSIGKLMNAFIFKFPKAIAAMLKGYIPIKLGGYLDIATADFFLDKDGVVLEAKYSLKDAFDGFEFSEIKEFSLR